MNKTERLIKLARLEELLGNVDSLRKELGVSAQGEEVVNDEVWDDRRLVVVADGLGGADLEYVEGHYPIEHLELNSRHYSDEDKACLDCSRLSACYQGEQQENEEDNDKDWDDLIQEIFVDKKKAKKAKK